MKYITHLRELVRKKNTDNSAGSIMALLIYFTVPNILQNPDREWQLFTDCLIPLITLLTEIRIL